MSFICIMNIYTQLHVYMWMYLRNSRTVLIILVKKSVGKQGRKCLPFTLTLWSPPLPQVITQTPEKRTHATHIHTNTRTHVHKSSNALLTTSQRQSPKLLSINKQTPTYSSDRIDTDENIDLVHRGGWCRLRSFFFCHFMSFMCDANYVYKCDHPTSIQYFLNTPGQHYFLEKKTNKTVWWTAEGDSRDTFCHPSFFFFQRCP